MGLGKDILKKSVGIGFVKDMKQAGQAAEMGVEALRQKDEMLAQGAAMRSAQGQMPGAGPMPSAGPISDAELEPIAGVSLEQYVTIAKASATSGGDAAAVAAVAGSHGVSAADWDTASTGWAARIQANRAVGQRFNELYMGGVTVGLFKNMNALYKAGGSPLSTEAGEKRAASREGAMAKMAAAQEQLAQHTQMAQLATNGADATALVLDVSQTDRTINMQPVIDFELQVTRPGLPPYPLQLSQPVPQLYLSKIQAGANLAAKVDPANPDSVFLDFGRS